MNSGTIAQEGKPFLSVVRNRCGMAASWLAVALGVSIPMSTAADSVILGLLLVCWLLGGRVADVRHILRTSSFARASWLLLGVMFLGLFWGTAGLDEGLQYIGKYKQLLFVPIFMTLLSCPRHRSYAMKGFGFAMMVTLVLSYAIALDLIPTGNPKFCYATNACVLKSHIAQSHLMAFAAFLWALAASKHSDGRFRIFYGALALAAAYNVLFMVIGRTGHVAILILAGYWAFSTYRWRGAGLAFAVILAIIGIGMLSSAIFVERMKQGVDDISQWTAGQGPVTSMGGRMDLYRDSFKVISDHPLVGVGTGGLSRRDGGNVNDAGAHASINPHNQYLLMAIRLGLIGLAALAYFFYCHWKQAMRLQDNSDRRLAVGLLLIMTVGCLFNSLLMDHAEGWFYAWFASVLFAGSGQPGAASASK